MPIKKRSDVPGTKYKVEVPRPDEVPRPSSKAVQYRKENRNEKSAALLRSRPFTVVRLKTENLEFQDERYRECWFAAEKWLRRRITTIRDLYGAVSDGTAAVLASASRAYAKSAYFEILGAEGDREAMSLASKFAVDARQHELAAMGIAGTEAKAFARTAPVEKLPWLLGEAGAAAEVGRRVERAIRFRTKPIETEAPVEDIFTVEAEPQGSEELPDPVEDGEEKGNGD